MLHYSYDIYQEEKVQGARCSRGPELVSECSSLKKWVLLNSERWLGINQIGEGRGKREGEIYKEETAFIKDFGQKCADRMRQDDMLGLSRKGM